MDSLKLKELELRFNEKCENASDTNEVYDLYETFYQWLNKQEGGGKELLRVKHTLLYKALRWFDVLHIREKDLSKHWNKGLVKRIATCAEKEKQYMENGRASSVEAQIDRELWVTELSDEMDFATVVYCYRILENSGIFSIPLLLSSLDSTIGQPTVQTVLRPRYDGKLTIKDDGRKYWNAETGELMTYDECSERGLKHNMLMYASGLRKGTYVGFGKPEGSKPSTRELSNEGSDSSTKICDVVLID